MYRSVFVACILVSGCAIWSAIGQGMGHIPGVTCTQTDIVNMMGKCMLKFTRGHSAPVIAKMRKSLTCNGQLINCTVVMETRLCLADLAIKELSQPCKPFVDQVADYQFGVFNIPCRVSHLKTTCRDFFLQHNITQFDNKCFAYESKNRMLGRNAQISQHCCDPQNNVTTALLRVNAE